ncbi:hypothetical protein Clacol_002162 [Clathrus columnatus]|uniref:Uncharacterized protein n=1 Tax=Clathrus columnatus TaxID=1419009 RepID=A0AAV5A4L3_9AGAM|nr:hypothetical protein Clacol_002162 [Clathrus columnatus]
MAESMKFQQLSPSKPYQLKHAESDTTSVCASGENCSNTLDIEENPNPVLGEELRSSNDEEGEVTTVASSRHENDENIQESASSSVPSERDKLAELPASTTFSAQRVFSLSRKVNTDTSSLHTHESFTSSLNHPKFRPADSDNSLHAKSRELLPKRVSFDNDRLSVSSSNHNVKGAFGMSHSLPITRTEEQQSVNAKARSLSLSRARSPSPALRALFHKPHPREEPFLPIDPYKANICSVPKNLEHLLLQLFRQAYRHVLLRLPSIYFSRVSRVFTDAELSRPEVERMIERRNQIDGSHWPADHDWIDPNVSPAMIRFKESWEGFIESVLKEWKTLNVISALLLTAVLAILQIEGVSRSLVIRSSASLSLICGLMSLVYGGVYILRFATMKSMYRAFIWAEEAQQATSLVWNIWVLLSMPAVWIAWSMLFFCISILAFVWEQPNAFSFDDIFTENDALTREALWKARFSSTGAAIVPKVLVSFVFILGLLYFALVIRTFRSWRDTGISQGVRNSMEIGRWTTRSPSPGKEIANMIQQAREGSEKQGNVEVQIEGKACQSNSKMVEQKKSRRTRSVESCQ